MVYLFLFLSINAIGQTRFYVEPLLSFKLQRNNDLASAPMLQAPYFNILSKKFYSSKQHPVQYGINTGIIFNKQMSELSVGIHQDVVSTYIGLNYFEKINGASLPVYHHLRFSKTFFKSSIALKQTFIDFINKKQTAYHAIKAVIGTDIPLKNSNYTSNTEIIDDYIELYHSSVKLSATYNHYYGTNITYNLFAGINYDILFNNKSNISISAIYASQIRNFSKSATSGASTTLFINIDNNIYYNASNATNNSGFVFQISKKFLF